MLTVGVWLTVDATLDNVAHNAVVAGDQALAERARLSEGELAFVRDCVDAAAGITHRILGSPQLHPSVRQEQQQSLVALQEASEALDALAAES